MKVPWSNLADWIVWLIWFKVADAFKQSGFQLGIFYYSVLIMLLFII